jgi:hypothetical protein
VLPIIEPRQRNREGQEDQLGALGIVVNAVVLWNTHYIERALKQLEQMGLAVVLVWPFAAEKQGHTAGSFGHRLRRDSPPL